MPNNAPPWIAKPPSQIWKMETGFAKYVSGSRTKQYHKRAPTRPLGKATRNKVSIIPCLLNFL